MWSFFSIDCHLYCSGGSHEGQCGEVFAHLPGLVSEPAAGKCTSATRVAGEGTNRQRLLVSKGRVVWEEKTWKKKISELDVHWSNYSNNFKYIFQYHSITKYVWANQTSFLGYKTCWGERGVDHVVARAPKLGKTHLQYIVGRHSNHMFAWWFLDIFDDVCGYLVDLSTVLSLFSHIFSPMASMASPSAHGFRVPRWTCA